ncbi:DUF3078 domain-containing protein [Elizabethkingia miricola]|uniref:DUF3078 domain-containing protein n=1 Tax=Elizabethkingia miricola TaxID=172045 RepID=UPI000C15321B|nr:DUF3078 domain-containing protein [Elizabethkingia miricola]PSL87428.1 DUF3078 domain-containing protein [Elizabethkingia miricola]QHQ87156.1 DUF3078 domain-containing protein [Elizabethkingia miricola]WNG63362.1 DUF3078 domain-containing protein [Elizabethkingia miricola]
MNRVLIGTLFFFAMLVSAQHAKTKAVIDSINQAKWKENSVNVDSLSNFSMVKIPRIKIDTIIIQQPVLIGALTEPILVTPYQIMRSPSLRRWYVYGQNNVLFNQAAFSNWNAGGNNSVGINAKVNYSLIYKKGRHFLDNNFQLGYGLVSSQGQSSRKTDDYINIMSNYGYDLRKNYYLSAGIQFLSQFSPGYNYSTTPEPVYNDRISKFMAPGYLNIGLGISFNPKENFQVIFRPATGRFTFVLDPKLQVAGNYGLERNGQSVRTEFGALANIMYKIQIMKDFSFTNQLNLFSSYTSHPERVDISYTGVVNIKFNKFISTIISVDLLYDHDQIQKLQMKQTLGVGISYNLGLQAEDRPDGKKFIKPFATGVRG